MAGVSEPGGVGGVRRHRRVAVVPVGLVVAVVAVAVLVGLPAPVPLRASAPGGVRTLAQAWPKARPGALPAALPDGSTYQPVLVVPGGGSAGAPSGAAGAVPAGTAATALVVAPSADRTANRLVLLAPDRAVTLGTAPADAPGFTAVTAAGGQVYWARTVPDAAGDARTSLWTASAAGAGVREIVADAGAVIFDRSQYDLQVAAGRLRWLVALPGSAALSARSVPAGAGQPPVAGGADPGQPVTGGAGQQPVSGGAVEERAVPAGYAPLAWPWFSDVGSAGGAAAALYDAANGRRVVVRVPAGAVATCTTEWCQVQGGGTHGPSGVELVRPDGSGRQRVAGAGTATPVVDVALLGRFEVLSVSAPAGATGTPPQQLLLYDARHRRTAELAAAATAVQARDGVAWWSVGAGEGARWSWLSLSTLD